MWWYGGGMVVVLVVVVVVVVVAKARVQGDFDIVRAVPPGNGAGDDDGDDGDDGDDDDDSSAIRRWLGLGAVPTTPLHHTRPVRLSPRPAPPFTSACNWHVSAERSFICRRARNEPGSSP